VDDKLLIESANFYMVKTKQFYEFSRIEEAVNHLFVFGP